MTKMAGKRNNTFENTKNDTHAMACRNGNGFVVGYTENLQVGGLFWCACSAQLQHVAVTLCVYIPVKQARRRGQTMARGPYAACPT